MIQQKPTNNFWLTFAHVSLLFVLLLLIGNVSLILYAVTVNRYICAQAAQAGAAAWTNGGGQRDIETAVFQIINTSDVHNFCMNQPELGELRFYTKYDKGARQPMMLVRTITGVHVPAPFLLFVTSPEANGLVRFDSSCAIKLKNVHAS